MTKRAFRKFRARALINEEALLLAQFLRDEKKIWTPRIVQSNGRKVGI